MASRKTKRQKIGQNPPHVLVVAPPTMRPDEAELFKGAGSILFQAVIFLVAFAIIFSRRPDAVLNAQFYAEDGKYWYPDAYQLGLHSFLMPVAGYLHTFTRMVALFSLLFPFSLAPLVMNLCAIVVQILPVNVFLSSRFSPMGLQTRLLGALLYLAVPNSYEIDANITNVQWHLALLACMLLLAQPASSRGWRLFDGTVLLLTSFSSAIAILLIPVAAALWWKRRPGSALSMALLAPGALVQVLVALFSHSRQLAPNGATFARLISILGRQLFLSALLGLRTQFLFTPAQNGLAPGGNGVFLVEIIAATTGLALVLYALRHAPAELRLFILFAFGVLALGLARPLAGSADRPQWEWLLIPRDGQRYFFLPMLASLASLFWIVGNPASPRKLRYFVAGLLMLLPIGIYQDWRYPPFEDFHFHQYAAQFEQSPPGTKVTIPINPGWSMEITKH